VDPAKIKAAADILAESRLGLQRLDRLPDGLVPPDEATAYAVQQEVNARIEAAFGRPGGWKIGCTTATMQRYLQIGQPCAGEMFDRFILPSGGEVPRRCFVRPGVECEIAVELKSTLAGTTPAEVAGCVGAVMASIEIVDDRYEDYRELDVHTLIADDFFNAGCVLGEPVGAWERLDLAGIGGAMWVDGMKIGAGRGGDILGHPLKALAWLSRRLGELGRAAEAGSVVTLGSLVQTAWVERGQLVEIEVEGLGEARIRFA
jgi:2-keto-4-pentenoate hydratase